MKFLGSFPGSGSRAFSGGKPRARPAVVLVAAFPAAVLLAGILPISMLACAGPVVKAEGPDRHGGVWEGSGQGWGGEIRVRLRINSALIQEIEILPHNEDPYTGGEAMEELLELVLDYQSAGLDAVSGATESSAGFLAAVEDALSRARVSGQQ